MSQLGNIQLTVVVIAPPEWVAEGERIFKSHDSWMKSTHHRDGIKALVSYSVSKGPELVDPLDTNSAQTGNTCFILTEVYATEAGVADHYHQAFENWQEFPAFRKWLDQCQATVVPAASIINSLW